MKDIIQIIIESSSGFGPVQDAFTDKLILTEDSISYEYNPEIETRFNPKIKWSYKIDKPFFKAQYERIVGMISAVIEKQENEFCTDIGGIEFDIVYSDQTKFNYIYMVPGDRFKELFDEIEQLVPGTECTPAVLLTSRNHNGRYVNDLEAFMEYIHKAEMNNRSKNPERTPGWLRKIKEFVRSIHKEKDDRKL